MLAHHGFGEEVLLSTTGAGASLYPFRVAETPEGLKVVNALWDWA